MANLYDQLAAILHNYYLAECVDVGLLEETAADFFEADNTSLRKLLWLRHNPDHSSSLYGDDGEMQCGLCGVDFKRMEVSDIEAGLNRFLASQSLPCPHARPSWHSCPHCLGINGP